MNTPSSRRTTGRPLLVGLAAALVLAGCGGGDSTPDAAVAEPTTPAASAPAEPSPTPSSESSVASPSTKPPAAAGPLRVVYTNENGLWSATLGGGAPKKLATHTDFTGLAVSPDGKTVAYAPKDEGLFLVDVDGGTPRLLDKDGLGDPVFSPDGKIIAMIQRDDLELNVYSINIDGTGSKKLTSGSNYFVQYFPDGDLLVGGPHSLSRVPAGGGAAKKILGTGDSQFIHAVDLSPDGRRIAYAFEAEGSLESPKTDIYVMDADGKNRKRLTTTKDAFWPSWAPNGTTLAFSRGCDGTNCPNKGAWTIESNGTKLRRIATFGNIPVFTPDGRYIVFDMDAGLGVVRPDGTGRKTLGKGKVDYFAFVPASA